MEGAGGACELAAISISDILNNVILVYAESWQIKV